MMKTRKRLVLTTLAFCLLAGVATRSRAAIVYATGFENPPFVLGPIDQQDGWFNNGGTTASKTIEDTFVHTGNQALLIDPSGEASGQQDAIRRHSLFDTAAGPEKVVTMASDVYIQSGASQTRWVFIATDGSGAIIGGFSVRDNDAVQLVTAGSPIVPGATFVRDQWNGIAVSYDFASKTFDVFINGGLIASGEAFLNNSGSTVFDVGAFGAAGAAGPVNDRAYYDNYSVIASVPEPSSLTLAGIAGVIGLAVLRCRVRAALPGVPRHATGCPAVPGRAASRPDRAD